MFLAIYCDLFLAKNKYTVNIVIIKDTLDTEQNINRSISNTWMAKVVRKAMLWWLLLTNLEVFLKCKVQTNLKVFLKCKVQYI